MADGAGGGFEEVGDGVGVVEEVGPEVAAVEEVEIEAGGALEAAAGRVWAGQGGEGGAAEPRPRPPRQEIGAVGGRGELAAAGGRAATAPSCECTEFPGIAGRFHPQAWAFPGLRENHLWPDINEPKVQ